MQMMQAMMTTEPELQSSDDDEDEFNETLMDKLDAEDDDEQMNVLMTATAEYTFARCTRAGQVCAPFVRHGPAATALTTASEFERRESRRQARVRLLVTNLLNCWRSSGVDVNNNEDGTTFNKPANIAAYLSTTYLHSTALSYYITARSLCRSEIGTPQQWKDAYTTLAMRKAEEDVRPYASRPLTPDEVVALCGNLRLPVQRCILLMFITGARFSETRDRKRNGKITYRTHEKCRHSSPDGSHYYIEFHLACHKAAMLGQRPFSRWIDVTHLDESLFDDHHLERREVYDHIKKICPDASVHGCRKGALQLLADSGISAETIASLSGHQMAAKVRSATAYVGTRPDQPEVQKVMALSTLLLASLRHAGLRLPPRPPAH